MMSNDPINVIAGTLDELFNGNARGAERKTGFVLIVYPVGDNGDRRPCSFVSNCADRWDAAALFKEMAARFEGQPEMEGSA
jgi:hypothetical protein